MQYVKLVMAILEALPLVVAKGAEAVDRVIDAFKTGNPEIDAKLAAMKQEDIRRAIISEAEAAS